MSRIWSFAPIVLLAALLAVAAFVLMRGGAHETLTAGDPRRPAPTFALAELGARGLITSDRFAGRAYVINVFASWCTPCRGEHPLLLALKQRGVAVLGVAYKDKPEDTAAYLRDMGDPYEAVALDPDGRYAMQLGTAGVPESFVIGADGRIRTIYRGPLTDAVVAQQIAPALNAR